MAHAQRIVHDAVEKFGGTCPMETVSVLCPGLSETQVFFAIDEMSRSGELRLMRDAEGAYFVRVCEITPWPIDSSRADL